jgi:RimJ/RimL family protein N-acetyltransferase
MSDNDPLPVGPRLDTTPKPIPARIPLRGRYVTLEPLHPRHVPELWRAAQGADDSFTYMNYGPFAAEEAVAKEVMAMASDMDRMTWAVRPVTTGEISGWLSLIDIQPKTGAIEIGNIWFGPRMQRTRAATESIFLLLKLAADDLGYRRLVWKCNSLNAPSKRAAARLGFVHEGLLRMHMITKGRRRDTDYYSIIEDEWPLCRDALLEWLDAANFDLGGTALRGLAEIRNALRGAAA